MTLSVAIQMDSIEHIDIKSDSTFIMALEAEARGYKNYHYLAKNLTFKNQTKIPADFVYPNQLETLTFDFGNTLEGDFSSLNNLKSLTFNYGNIISNLILPDNIENLIINRDNNLPYNLKLPKNLKKFNYFYDANQRFQIDVSEIDEFNLNLDYKILL